MGLQMFVDFVKPFIRSLEVDGYSASATADPDEVTGSAPDIATAKQWSFNRARDETSVLLAQAIATGADLGTVTFRLLAGGKVSMRVLLPQAILTTYSGGDTEQFTIECAKPTVFYPAR